jgi:hypothetical protein
MLAARVRELGERRRCNAHEVRTLVRGRTTIAIEDIAHHSRTVYATPYETM